MPQLTPEDAADRLGIADEHVEVFVRIVDALRTPAARQTEVDQLRAELEAVNNALIEAGITHPLGARGVRDLGAALRMAREDVAE